VIIDLGRELDQLIKQKKANLNKEFLEICQMKLPKPDFFEHDLN
jgi:hypothetical protein